MDAPSIAVPWPHSSRGGDVGRRGGAAAAWGDAFRGLGCRPGQRVALLMPHSERQITMFLGALHGGFVPSILAWPTARMDAEKYARNVREALPREGTRFWLRPLFYVAAAELIFMFDQSNAAFIYFQF